MKSGWLCSVVDYQCFIKLRIFNLMILVGAVSCGGKDFFGGANIGSNFCCMCTWASCCMAPGYYHDCLTTDRNCLLLCKERFPQICVCSQLQSTGRS